MRTHLEARRTLTTCRMRDELLVVSPINNDINEVKAKLKKLVARNTEATQSTVISSFSAKI